MINYSQIILLLVGAAIGLLPTTINSLLQYRLSKKQKLFDRKIEALRAYSRAASTLTAGLTSRLAHMEHLMQQLQVGEHFETPSEHFMQLAKEGLQQVRDLKVDTSRLVGELSIEQAIVNSLFACKITFRPPMDFGFGLVRVDEEDESISKAELFQRGVTQMRDGINKLHSVVIQTEQHLQKTISALSGEIESTG